MAVKAEVWLGSAANERGWFVCDARVFSMLKKCSDSSLN